MYADVGQALVPASRLQAAPLKREKPAEAIGVRQATGI